MAIINHKSKIINRHGCPGRALTHGLCRATSIAALLERPVLFTGRPSAGEHLASSPSAIPGGGRPPDQESEIPDFRFTNGPRRACGSPHCTGRGRHDPPACSFSRWAAEAGRVFSLESDARGPGCDPRGRAPRRFFRKMLCCVSVRVGPAAYSQRRRPLGDCGAGHGGPKPSPRDGAGIGDRG